MFNKYNIETGAKEIVDNFENQPTKKPTQNTIEEPNANDIVIGGVSEETPSDQSQSGTQKTTYYGYNVVGTISIPSIKIEYPILEKVTTQSLKVAVVYLSGAGINKVGNTVLQGHNYRNGTMFSNLNKLRNGDAIYITDETRTKIKYEVYNNFEAEATDTSFYNRDTAGLREVTLSTCTNDTAIRTIILAKEVQE